MLLIITSKFKIERLASYNRYMSQTLENSFKEQVCLEHGEGFRKYMLHNATIPKTGQVF